MKFLITISFILSLFLYSASAQENSGTRDSIYSELLKEKRFVQVVLPPYHKPGSTNTYDVIYLLDGNWNTTLLSQIHRFVKNEKLAPEVIIVGIYHPDRNKDLTPTAMSRLANSGNAGNFLSFLKSELIPYIDKTYPVTSERILVGHSFGGLFSMYACVTEPTLFSSYISLDPALWWDSDYTIRLADQNLKHLSGMKKTLFIAGREGGLEGMGISRMETVLQAKAPRSLKWEVAAYKDETHNSIKFKSLYDGLKQVYKGYKPPNKN